MYIIAPNFRARSSHNFISVALPLRPVLMHRAAGGVNFVQDSFGKSEYLSQCEQLGIIPSTQVVKFLQHDELDLAHYGLGDKGVVALCAALLVRAWAANWVCH